MARLYSRGTSALVHGIAEPTLTRVICRETRKELFIMGEIWLRVGNTRLGLSLGFLYMSLRLDTAQ